MESTFKRSLDDSSPPPAAPAASTSEPAAKRPRTSQPSGVPGIEDVPVDKAERDAFFSVTSNHFAMGAVPVIDRVKQLEDQERCASRAWNDGESELTLVAAGWKSSRS